jgi:hypothetical protein
MIKRFFSLIFILMSIFLLSKVSLAEMPPSPPNDDNIIDNNIDDTEDDNNNQYVNAHLIRSQNGYKVYEIINDKRHWIPTAELFNVYHFNWQNVQVVNEGNLLSYPRVKLLRAADDPKVYYLTESGMIRHIPSAAVFESYGNHWEDILEVSSEEIEVYESNHLIRQTGDNKVYYLKNALKHWIKTPAAFNRRGYDWNKIAPVNQTELETYSTGFSLE